MGVGERLCGNVCECMCEKERQVSCRACQNVIRTKLVCVCACMCACMCTCLYACMCALVFSTLLL